MPEYDGQKPAGPGTAKPTVSEQTPSVPDADSEPLLAEAPISVVKLAFGHSEVSVFGLLAIFFNRARYQVLRTDTVVNFEARLFDVNPGIPWQDFERTIIDQLTRQHLNFRLTNELRAKLDEHINYRKFEEFSALLRTHDHERLTIFLRAFLEKLYGVPGFRTVLFLEEIFEDDFERRAPDEEVTPVAPEGEEEDVSSGTPFSPATPILSPVFGTVVAELEVGDSIWVRPQNPDAPDRKALSEEAVIRSITHDDSTGFTILAELGPGRIVRLIET
ncbi:MAG TPA: hypothetical protein PLD82_09170, partial [Spirochaetota bacterium]|nr:hypothetical protein [Spirochaetota bacterium]